YGRAESRASSGGVGRVLRGRFRAASVGRRGRLPLPAGGGPRCRRARRGVARVARGACRRGCGHRDGPERREERRGPARRGSACGERLTVLRIPDQAFPVAAMVGGVVPSVDAVHLGVAVADADIDTFLTYERQSAQLARMYGLLVLTPGLPDHWWA